MRENNMKVIAHRGGAGLGGVENTMDAFVNAIKLGVDMVEFDVRRTKDNALIVIHDSDIDGRKISEMTFDEIQEEALNVLSEKNSGDPSWLYYNSANSGGARPKADLTPFRQKRAPTRGSY